MKTKGTVPLEMLDIESRNGECALGGLICGPDTAKERASEFERVSAETPHTEVQTEYLRTVG